MSRQARDAADTRTEGKPGDEALSTIAGHSADQWQEMRAASNWVGNREEKTVGAPGSGMIDFGLDDVFASFAPAQKQPLSVKDLIDQFDQDQVRREVNLIREYLDAPAGLKDHYLDVLEDSQKEAERTRIRLESLTTEDLQTIAEFGDAIKNGDFERVGQLVKSFKDNPKKLAKLTGGIQLQLEREGLGNRLDADGWIDRDGNATFIIGNVNGRPVDGTNMYRKFRTDDK